ncbi:MAG: ABC transporter ATP-binding protein [Phycisphaerae bacterium]
MPLIDIRKLTKLYRMGDSTVRALDGVDLSIEAGEFVAITGASGSGKSTMMHLLGCLDRPTAGSYVLNGRDVSIMNDRELAVIRNREIGFVFQTFNLINRTSAVENVGVPLFYARRLNTFAPAKKALERVGLGHRYGHKPNELSGGERQRVAIARAIVNEPVLLLADEPTGNLDSRTGEQIMEIFHSLNRQGVTIIIVTHEPSVARQARRIVHMRDGHIVSDGPPSDTNVRTTTSLPSPHLPVVASSTPISAPQPNTDLLPQPVAVHADATPSPTAMSRGATIGVWLGGIAVSLSIACFAIARVLAATLGPEPKFSPEHPPSTPIVIAGLALILGYVAAIAVGLTAVIRGYFTIRAIRTSPTPLVGTGRAWTGIALGAVGLLIPFVPMLVGPFVSRSA